MSYCSAGSKCMAARPQRHAPFTSQGRASSLRSAAAACRERRTVAVSAAAAQKGAEDGVLIVGAGLAGLCLAAALDKAGIPNQVLEQRGELSRDGAAIGIWGNGMKALDVIGVGEAIRQEYTPTDRIRLCRDSGRVLREFSFQECDGGPHEFYGVSRAFLQSALQAAVPKEHVLPDADFVSVDTSTAQRPSVILKALQAAVPKEHVLLDADVVSVDTSTAQRPSVILKDGRKLSCRLLVGADGVRSTVADSIGQPAASFVGQAGYRGVATFPGGMPLDKGVICQVWGEGMRAGMYPMSATEVYWFVAFDSDGSRVEMSPDAMKADAARLVAGWSHGIVDCVAATPVTQLSRSRFLDRFPSPLGRLTPLNVTLAGDALHPMTPNMGQGGCVALEDGIVLARELKAAWSSDAAALQAALRNYETARAKRCLPLTIRSRGMGVLLQSALPPVVFARDAAISTLFQPAHFFDHTLFDCGTIDSASLA